MSTSCFAKKHNCSTLSSFCKSILRYFRVVCPFIFESTSILYFIFVFSYSVFNVRIFSVKKNYFSLIEKLLFKPFGGSKARLLFRLNRVQAVLQPGPWGSFLGCGKLSFRAGWNPSCNRLTAYSSYYLIFFCQAFF